ARGASPRIPRPPAASCRSSSTTRSPPQSDLPNNRRSNRFQGPPSGGALFFAASPGMELVVDGALPESRFPIRVYTPLQKETTNRTARVSRAVSWSLFTRIPTLGKEEDGEIFATL